MNENSRNSIYVRYLQILLVFRKKNMTILLFFFLTIMSFAQSIPNRQSAIEAFSKGDYSVAYDQFGKLLEQFPKDALYKYYKGACLVSLENNPSEAVRLLTEARTSSTVSRPIPEDALFWLARAKQQSGDFSEAVKLFNDFSLLVGKKRSREVGIPGYITQCERGDGVIEGSTVIKVEKPDNKQIELDVMAQQKETNDDLSGTIVADEEKVILPASYNEILVEAVDYQQEADSIALVVARQREEMKSADTKERTTLQRQITKNSNAVDSLQAIADDKFEEAQLLINETSFSSEVNVDKRVSDRAATVIEPFVIEANETIGNVPSNSAKSTADENDAERLDDIEVVDNDDAALQSEDDGRFATIEDAFVAEETIATENSPAVDTNQVVEVASSVQISAEGKPQGIGTIVAESVQALPGVTSLFSVDKSLATSQEAVVINPELPQGIIYRIQVAILRNPATQSTFKGLSPVYGLRDAGSSSTKYYVGLFREREDANKALVEVREVGFKDAYIISLLSGSAISGERAASLEQEWADVPFGYSSLGIQDIVPDTIPPVLSYRVELMRTRQPAKEDVLDNMKRLSETRGLDIYTLEDGNIVYLVGQFVSLESAEEYANLVSRNGFPDAKVAAWLGRKEIPMDTAKQLFDMI